MNVGHKTRWVKQVAHVMDCVLKRMRPTAQSILKVNTFIDQSKGTLRTEQNLSYDMTSGKGKFLQRNLLALYEIIAT